MSPALENIDHIQVYVSDRHTAESWYKDILDLHRNPKLELWSKSDDGPLMLTNTSGTVMLAIFEKPFQACRSTIAFAVRAKEFLVWEKHLRKNLPSIGRVVDHEVSWSIYFNDLDGNPYEITCYDYDDLVGKLGWHTWDSK